MTNVPPEIMNHLRAQLHKDRYPDGLVAPKQRSSIEDEIVSGDLGQERAEPGRVKGMLSRFALRAARPELSGD